MNSIAHVRHCDHKQQTVEEHLVAVKTLAGKYGAKLKLKHVTGLAGMLHDMGKYSHTFRAYILDAINGSITAKAQKGKVNHSTAGGRLLYERFHNNGNIYHKIVAEVVGNAIISHHSYLHDFINSKPESPYVRRMEKKEILHYESSKDAFFTYVMNEQDFCHYVDQAAMEVEQFCKDAIQNEKKKKVMMFLCKFVFSALIDADRTDTRLFEANQTAEPPVDIDQLFTTYYERLISKTISLQQATDANMSIHALRHNMSEQCDQFALNQPCIYTLSIPTGGGKTLASLRYALKHALTYKKKQIIYVVPYTTIIEQNAATVRDILCDDVHIIEHHCNVVTDDEQYNQPQYDQDGYAVTSQQKKLKLAQDNWDAPLIFTTMVQFLNVWFAHGSRYIRRLHHLCEAVIIFDEVQKVPTNCVSLFNQAANCLAHYGQSTIVLCTATQPALDFVKEKLDLSEKAEMIANIDEVIAAFKRVEIVNQATDKAFNNAELAQFVTDRIKEVQSVLVILNTKAVVKALYQLLDEQVLDKQGQIVSIYHLSTFMCAAHRKDTLAHMKERLANKQPVICISTPLIEAGVDISFECVIRSLAGLDSIAQAAGRCNRHGQDEIRQVYVIDHAEEQLQKLEDIKKGKEKTIDILLEMKKNPAAYGGHLLSRQAMERYFKTYYLDCEEKLDYTISAKINMIDLFWNTEACEEYVSKYGKEMLALLFNRSSYGTAAKSFKVIDDHTTAVIVPYRAGKEVITALNGAESISDLKRLLRLAQQFIVNMSKQELSVLTYREGIDSCLEGQVLIVKEGAYHEQFGVDSEHSHLAFIKT